MDPAEGMSLSEAQRLFRKIVGQIQFNRVAIRAETSAVRWGLKPNENGAYTPAQDGRPPTICLLRCQGYLVWHPESRFIDDTERFMKTSENIERDTYVLAHELGHHFSALQAKRTCDYEVAVNKLNSSGAASLSPLEQKFILEEEERAWTFARGILESSGLRSFVQFDHQSTQSLEAYISSFSVKP